MPKKINGWKQVNENKIDTHDDLYHYIDGGAELYISYNFKDAMCYIYKNKNQPELRIEIFDMVESKNAFGVFSLSSEKNDFQFGQGSQYIEGSLIIWKGEYFISIMAGSETAESKNTILEIAKIIDENIKETGPIPEILSFVPDKGKVKNSEIYFYHHAWQNTYYYISGDNIFNIDSTCDAVLANYESDKNSCTFLLIRYNSNTKAEEVQNKFMVTFLDEFVDEPIIKLENDKWMSCQFYKNYVFSIFKAKNKECIEELSKQVIKKINLN